MLVADVYTYSPLPTALPLLKYGWLAGSTIKRGAAWGELSVFFSVLSYSVIALVNLLHYVALQRYTAFGVNKLSLLVRATWGSWSRQAFCPPFCKKTLLLCRYSTGSPPSHPSSHHIHSREGPNKHMAIISLMAKVKPHLFPPILCSLWVYEVRECRLSRPHLPNEHLLVSILQ